MCIAYPMRSDKVHDQIADVSIGDIKSQVSVYLVDKPRKGDYVLVHAGIAIEKIDAARATEILTLITELGQKIDQEKS